MELREGVYDIWRGLDPEIYYKFGIEVKGLNSLNLKLKIELRICSLGSYD